MRTERGRKGTTGASPMMVTEPQRIETLIQLIRGQRVILDSSLARLYGVTTARLNEQVRRNADRFPPDFMFRLTRPEFAALISQNATSKTGRGGRRKLPMVFTEHGAIMAANVLNSGRAIQISVFVVRAFVRLRHSLPGPDNPRAHGPARAPAAAGRVPGRGGPGGLSRAAAARRVAMIGELTGRGFCYGERRRSWGNNILEGCDPSRMTNPTPGISRGYAQKGVRYLFGVRGVGNGSGE